MTKKILLFVLLFCLFAFSVSAQDKQTKNQPKPSPPPGRIKLLDGYTHFREQGIDTSVGRIKKEGGLDIAYDIGHLAGEYTNTCVRDKNNCVWFKEQKLELEVVKIALTKDGEIIATFPKTTANFFARVKSQEDIADFLIMILTY